MAQAIKCPAKVNRYQPERRLKFPIHLCQQSHKNKMSIAWVSNRRASLIGQLVGFQSVSDFYQQDLAEELIKKQDFDWPVFGSPFLSSTLRCPCFKCSVISALGRIIAVKSWDVAESNFSPLPSYKISATTQCVSADLPVTINSN